MKKFLALLLTLVILLSLAGCTAADNLQMETTLPIQGTTEPLFWPPLPTDTESTEESVPATDTQPSEAPEKPVVKPGNPTTPTKPKPSTDDTDATYIPREEDENTAPGKQEEDREPVIETNPEEAKPVIPDDPNEFEEPVTPEVSEEQETAAPTEETVQPTKPAPVLPPPPVVSGLKVHFIDVGQADAILIQCEDMNMLIDGGNKADSNVMYTYLKKYGVTHLDYVIGTHAHEDHIGGIPGALQYATAGTVYCPVKTYSSKAFENFVKSVTNRGTSIKIPKVGTSFSLGSASVKILAVNAASGTNNTSIVTRITHGNNSFLFMGDAEREVEQYLINSGAAQKATVLKVGHHGSDTSSGYQFLWNVMPEYAVISAGKGNSYGHPHDEVLSRFRDADVTLFRTDMQGDIICTSDGSSVSFTVSRNAGADTFS